MQSRSTVIDSHRSDSLSRTLLRASLLMLCLATPLASAQASIIIGDLVYCDMDSDGIYGPGDLPLDGVDVRVVCSNIDNETCFDDVVTTGDVSNVHPSVFQLDSVCAEEATWDITNADEHHGRYIVDVFTGDVIIMVGGIEFISPCFTHHIDNIIANGCW